MKGIYAGSFDPPTNGHLWMIEQGARLFSRFYVAIGENSAKKYCFTLDERIEMLEELCSRFPHITVVHFQNKFLVKYAESIGVDCILRGIRNEKDYTYERGMRYVNGNMTDKIQTLFMMSPRNLVEVSSSLIKGLVGSDDWEQIVREYVPDMVYYKMLSKFGGIHIQLPHREMLEKI
ncbi:pantetheine-phosphate adenylyltransferase [Desulfobulbus oligotrophicus]|jgi:pantetheine-phosphate adenylyltransferase|uniref:Phosphopantetheine adenylyltransferase n=1 Tax=Desulfobulbus oligotrophicus TaxID=1909699 RepID=A0A7T5VDV1_9BACT|nr:pantetheine-phosphate adenylyltransferase [Desulfobulbus oligotrophicus]MDY0389409.1 pantetheine-phosphate adenylyltransferase [Desulfobulbus oligotrophicus]QQG65949.1 pantetheine-phosphate adenylyltransferase [Desulfobulbus oligotrophicus]